MPPKESAAARKAREKQERWLAAQFQERMDQELEEDRGRSQVELLERLGRTETELLFYEEMTQPAARLMVPHSTFESLQSKMRHEGAVSAQRLLAMQVELRKVEKGSAQLQIELAHLRNDVRHVISDAHKTLTATRSATDVALESFIDEMRASVASQEADAEGCAASLNQVLRDARIRQMQVARKAQVEAHRVTEIWKEATSMHTRIPPRIRKTLQSLDKDDLLLILDSLSFEAVVQRYLLYRFTPGPDDPFKVDADPASPTLGEGLLLAAPTGPEL
jgi:hypothetical protein